MSTAEDSKPDNTPPQPTASTVDTRLYQILSNISSQKTLQPQHVQLLGTLAFGNDAAKHAIANVDGLISGKLLEYYCDSEFCDGGNNSDNNASTTNNSMQFLRTLRACVVNCALARSQCHSQKLYEKMVQEMKQHKETFWQQQDKNDEQQQQQQQQLYLTTLQDYVTTLCALCINDEENTNLLQATLEKEKVNLTTDFLPPSNEASNNNSSSNKKTIGDIQQRISFLEALMA